MKMGHSLLSSSFMKDLSWLMDYINSLLLGVVIFVFLMMVYLFMSKSFVSFPSGVFTSGELWCGLIPALILVMQMVPSFFFLFESEVVKGIGIEIKVTGQQWYWNYHYSNLGEWLKFDSYMLGLSDMGMGAQRLLEVDERLVVPVGVKLNFSFFSNDVIHSWSLPLMGVKMDVMPGFFSVGELMFSSVGVFYGMCSEFCGVGHSFMPIVVEVVPNEVFLTWCEDRKHLLDIVTRLGDWYLLHGVSSFV